MTKLVNLKEYLIQEIIDHEHFKHLPIKWDEFQIFSNQMVKKIHDKSRHKKTWSHKIIIKIITIRVEYMKYQRNVDTPWMIGAIVIKKI